MAAAPHVIRVRCPKCHKRLEVVTVVLNGAGQVVLAQHYDPRVVLPSGTITTRAASGAARAPGQPGPRSGFVGEQTVSEERWAPRVWRWRCPCGARPRVNDSVLRAQLTAVVRAGGRDLTLS